MKNKIINLTSDFFSGADLTSNETKILDEIIGKTGFKPEKNIWRSSYWGSKQIGASHWSGTFEGKSVVLKIQGAKPNTSEVDLIKEFAKQNKSKVIRPPIIYYTIPWNDIDKYEAIVAEYVQGEKVIEDGKLVTAQDVSNIMRLYKEYRKNCIPEDPWVEKPSKDINFEPVLDDLIAASVKAYPDNKLRNADDFDLARSAYKLLSGIYSNASIEFMHGHLSCKDLIYQDSTKKEVVLFSNLFWKWRYPYFDAVFAYHWFMYELAHVKNITPNEVESQRKIWLDEIFSITEASNSVTKTRLLNAALLERSVAGFIIDSFLCDPKKDISKYLYESTKTEAKRIISELE